MIDRQMQKTQNFTGIVGVNTQDFALQEGMGPICDRSKEFLGTSDKAIVAMRRLLLDAIAVNEKGGTPRAVDPKTYRNVRAYDRVVADGPGLEDGDGKGSRRDMVIPPPPAFARALRRAPPPHAGEEKMVIVAGFPPPFTGRC